MLVVSDIDDVFLPKPNDLLVNVAESRAALESLLGRIGDMFQENSIIGSAMGPALQAGFKLMVNTLPSFVHSTFSKFVTGAHRWKDHRIVIDASFCRRWCPQKQRRSKNTRHCQSEFDFSRSVVVGAQYSLGIQLVASGIAIL